MQSAALTRLNRVFSFWCICDIKHTQRETQRETIVNWPKRCREKAQTPTCTHAHTQTHTHAHTHTHTVCKDIWLSLPSSAPARAWWWPRCHMQSSALTWRGRHNDTCWSSHTHNKEKKLTWTFSLRLAAIKNPQPRTFQFTWVNWVQHLKAIQQPS